MLHTNFPFCKVKTQLGSGVYKILCLCNNKFYIGSSVNITSRWRLHLSNLKNNKHHSPYLQNSFNIYGIDNFAFSLIEIVDKGNLFECEQKWLDITKSYMPDYGFNVSPNAFGGCLGVILSEVTRSKMADAHAKKLNREKVLKIKDMLSQGIRSKKIAKEFGVSACHIQQIKFGNCWKFVEYEGENKYIFGTAGELNPSAKLSEQNVAEIRKLFSENIKIRLIAEKFKVSKSTIEAIKYNRTWKNKDQ